jgi:histidine triad (HIT) family protein
MEDCIFCKIAAGEIPKEKTLHEDGEVVSFLDINQDEPGHSLVIPATHHRWFYEMPDGLSEKLFRTAKHLSAELKEKYQADYVRLSIVGTDMPHVHVHLIPKKLSEKVNPA